MATDAAVSMGLAVPRLAESTQQRLRDALPATANVKNPVDVIGDARADRYQAALRHVLDDPQIDQVLVILTPQSMTDIEAIARGIVEIGRNAAKPIACSFMGAEDVAPGIRLLQEAHLPHYILPEWACAAMAAVQRIRAWRALELDEPEQLPVDRAAAARIIDSAPAGYLEEPEALAVLAAYGLPVPQHRLCTDADEAAQFADQIGYPVVLRIVSPQVVHKWDVGGVVLNLQEASAVRSAFEQMVQRVRQAVPQAEIRGAVVRRMIPPGHEVILGVKRDPSFGPVLMFGLGGLYVELFKDVTFGLAPISRGGAQRMLRQVKAFKILEGLRGSPPADVENIRQCIQRLGQLAADFPRISELDINPLIVGPKQQGNTVADVRIRLS